MTPHDRVRELKEQDGKDIVLTGSITLAHTPSPRLVDEFRCSSTRRSRARATAVPGRGEASRLQPLRVVPFRNGVTRSPTGVSDARGGTAG